MAHLLYQNICIVIGCCKQCIIPIQVFGSYTPVKIIAALNKTMEPVNCIQIEKALFFFCELMAVLYRTACSCRETMITFKSVAEYQRALGDMVCKKTCQFFCIRFCPVGRGSIGIPLALDSGTDTDIFTGDTSFLRFRTMLTGFAPYSFWKRFTLIAFKNKGLIQFGNLLEDDWILGKHIL